MNGLERPIAFSRAELERGRQIAEAYLLGQIEDVNVVGTWREFDLGILWRATDRLLENVASGQATPKGELVVLTAAIKDLVASPGSIPSDAVEAFRDVVQRQPDDTHRRAYAKVLAPIVASWLV